MYVLPFEILFRLGKIGFCILHSIPDYTHSMGWDNLLFGFCVGRFGAWCV